MIRFLPAAMAVSFALGLIAWVAWSTWRERKITKAIARRVYENQLRDVGLAVGATLRLALGRELTEEENWLINNTLEKIVLGGRVPNTLLEQVIAREVRQ